MVVEKRVGTCNLQRPWCDDYDVGSGGRGRGGGGNSSGRSDRVVMVVVMVMVTVMLSSPSSSVSSSMSQIIHNMPRKNHRQGSIPLFAYGESCLYWNYHI